MVEIRVMDAKKTTSIIKENLNPLWDERLTFEFRNLEPEDLNQGKCKVMVYDANMLRRNVLIGSFEFDLVSIYYKKNHELFCQWVTLIDVTGQHEGVQGFLKVTIVVLGPGDEQYIHSEDEMLELTDLFKPLMPPSIDPDPWILKTYVWRYEHMAIADRTSSSSDPYVEVEFAAAKIATSPIKKQLSADVRKCLTLKVMEPVLGDQIKVWFKDWDIVIERKKKLVTLKWNTHIKIKKGVQDDVLGMKVFSWEKAKASEGKEEGYPVHWIHLYGAPDLVSGALADKMNKGIIEGCWYRGSVLLQLAGKHIQQDSKTEIRQEVTEAVWDETASPAMERWILQ
ncbi:C2 domain containing protein, partial [Reticulomyxa filosa]